MKPIDNDTLQTLWFDADAREVRLRQLITDRIFEPPPRRSTITWWRHTSWPCAARQLHQAAKEIAYHATSGIKNPPPGSLLAQCTAHAAGVDAWDATGRIGLLHMAFPLKMLLQPDGHLTSCDLLHTVAGAIIFDVYENQDARLVSLQIPEHVLRTFPGPAYGPAGLRAATDFAPDEPAFGTILKPTAGITPDEVGQTGGRGRRVPAVAVRQGGRGPLSQPGLLARPRARARGGGGHRAGEGETARQGADLRPAHHRRPARDAGDAARRDRSRAPRA